MSTGEPKSLGQKIREARQRIGLTQSDLAGGMVTPSMISQIEADKAKPSYELLKSISQRLQMDVDFFMNDTQEAGQIASHLRIAEYQTVAKNGEMAREILESIDESRLRETQHTDYLLLMAQAHRLCGLPQAALPYLDSARDIAYRTRNEFLLLRLYKESGYIEYAMKNYHGAIIEWKRAVHKGEDILNDSSQPHGEVLATLRELYVQLATTAERELTSTDEYLSLAKEKFGTKLTMHELANAYIEDAVRCVENGSAEVAEELARRATAILSASAQVQYQLHLEALTGDPLEMKRTLHSDAAHAVIASHPHLYLRTELVIVKRLLGSKQYKRALEHLNTIETWMKWVEEGYVNSGAQVEMFYEFQNVRSEILYRSGRIEEAVAGLESFLESSYGEKLSGDVRRSMYGRIIQWHIELGHTEQIHAWIQRLENEIKQRDLGMPN